LLPEADECQICCPNYEIKVSFTFLGLLESRVERQFQALHLPAGDTDK